MPSRSNPRLSIVNSDVARRARELADTGDRWFLSFADGLVRVGGWARREADIAADSAVSAFSTTVRVAKKLSRTAAEPAKRKKPKRRPKSATRGRGDSSEPPRWQGIDLMAAMPASAWESATRERWSTERAEAPFADATPSPAGVVPVLVALGRTVADHGRAGYATLQKDERFWTLIRLLHQLGTPNPEPVRSPDPDLEAKEVRTKP